MRNNDRKPTAGQRIVAGLMAAVLFAVLLVGLVTGDMSSSRYPYLRRSTDPAFFWVHMILMAAAAGIAALYALGSAQPRPQPDYAAHVRRRTAEGFAFLALLGAAGTGYFWIGERLAGHESAISRLAGWTALAMLGIAAWPPLLAPGPARTVLRAAGTAVVLLAAAMIYPLMR